MMIPTEIKIDQQFAQFQPNEQETLFDEDLGLFQTNFVLPLDFDTDEQDLQFEVFTMDSKHHNLERETPNCIPLNGLVACDNHTKLPLAKVISAKTETSGDLETDYNQMVQEILETPIPQNTARKYSLREDVVKKTVIRSFKKYIQWEAASGSSHLGKMSFKTLIGRIFGENGQYSKLLQILL